MLVAVTDGDPRVLTIQDKRALPSGPFEIAHRSLQSGLRAWVERQTRLPLGYVEQLYTFADKDRAGAGQQVISISYLGLTREQPASGEYEASWASWYSYFPWEDHRLGAPAMIEERAGAAAARLDRGDGRSRPAPRPAAARRDHLRPRRPRLERGAGAAALRTAVRGAPHSRGAARRDRRRARRCRTARRPAGAR